MHAKIKSRLEDYKRYMKTIQNLEPQCFKIDALNEELAGCDGAKKLDYYLNPSTIHVNIWIEEVKVIPAILRVVIKHLGKITYRKITPSNKYFNFDFNKVYLFFRLEGDSCKLVQVGSETEEVPVYELQCSNGEAKAITEEDINSATGGEE